MNVTEYFADKTGTAILATTNAAGQPNTALYSRPYLIDDQTIALSMLERRSYANIQANPKVAYMFLADGGGAHKGMRFYLEVVGEETAPDKIAEIKAQHTPKHTPKHASKRIPTDVARHLILFKVLEIRPLVGDGPV